MKAPLFSLPVFDDANTVYRLEDDIGKVIIITFWASWCPDCGIDLPKKEQLFKSMATQNIKMLTINVSGRERMSEDAVTYANRFLSQLTLKDNGREVYDLFQCSGVPTTVIIDSNGNIFDKFGDSASFEEILKSLGKVLH